MVDWTELLDITWTVVAAKAWSSRGEIVVHALESECKKESVMKTADLLTDRVEDMFEWVFWIGAIWQL